LYEKVLLLWSQSLLVYVAGLAVLCASYTSRERSLRDVVGLWGSSLTLENTSIKIADSFLDRFFTGVHFGGVGGEKTRVLMRVLGCDE
jgi:hypothetical protein